MAHNYTQPKLYKGKFWYVWYRFRIPGTNKWKKFQVKKNINRIKNLSDRKAYGKNLVMAQTQLLQEGFNPFLEVSEMKSIQNKKEYTIKDAFEIALKIKKKEIKETTYRDYENRVFRFQEYLLKKGYAKIREVNKSAVSIFLDDFKPKNSNNFRVCLSSIFGVLSDRSIIDFNFVSELRAKKVEEKSITVYSEKQVNKIISLLEKEDKRLLLYIYLESYMFWRPIEIVRIELKNIDFEKMQMRSDTKGKANKVKIIPKIILDPLKEFINDRKNGRLFQLNAKRDSDKRQYLSDLFKKFRIRHNIDPSFKVYHFRHTNITKLYHIYRKEMPKVQAIELLSLITGHTSNAIWKYIKINDVELPDDYSHLLEKAKN